MTLPASLGARALRSSRKPVQVLNVSKRGLAAPASGSFQYETGETNHGVKYASRDLTGPTTTLTVVARAGTRYQPFPGAADALEKFAFKSTLKRSALRITREAELLGGELSAYHSRENLVIRAKFMRDDLPYFTELLGEVISKTRYTTHELEEEVIPVMRLDQKKLLGDPVILALNSVHGLAFHRGLGVPVNATSSAPFKYLDAPSIADFSDAAYARNNIAVVANGASHSDLSKWVGEFFTDTSTGSPNVQLPSNKTQYYGGEERIAHGNANVMIVAFPGSSSFTSGSSFKPEISVLAALLGGETSIKWSPGFSLLSRAAKDFPGVHVSTQAAAYSDAGLLYVTIKGNASQISAASKNVVDTLKKVAAGEVAEEDIKKATMLAKYRALESGQNIDTGLEATGSGLIRGGKAFQIDEIGQAIDKVSSQQVKSAAKQLLEQRASVSSVGDLHVLPFAEEIGLKI